MDGTLLPMSWNPISKTANIQSSEHSVLGSWILEKERWEMYDSPQKWRVDYEECWSVQQLKSFPTMWIDSCVDWTCDSDVDRCASDLLLQCCTKNIVCGASCRSLHGQEQSWTFAQKHVWLPWRWSKFETRGLSGHDCNWFCGRKSIVVRLPPFGEATLCVGTRRRHCTSRLHHQCQMIFRRLQEFWVVTNRWILGPAGCHDCVRVLGRIVEWTAILDMQNSSGSRSAWLDDPLRLLTSETNPMISKESFRSTGKRQIGIAPTSCGAQYLSSNRPQIQVECRDLARWRQQSSNLDGMGLKRLGRFLGVRPRLVWLFKWQSVSHVSNPGASRTLLVASWPCCALMLSDSNVCTCCKG